jgi:hypothetical protein
LSKVARWIVLTLIATAVGLLAILLAFFSLIGAWVLLVLPGTYLLAVYWLLKRARPKAAIPELSPEANELLARFPQFYSNPTANRSIGGAAGALALAGMVVALVGCLRGFWWGLLVGLVNLGVMAKLARAFEPTLFLHDQSERQAHNQILTHFAHKGWL